jgi:hypothetical protein
MLEDGVISASFCHHFHRLQKHFKDIIIMTCNGKMLKLSNRV